MRSLEIKKICRPSLRAVGPMGQRLIFSPSYFLIFQNICVYSCSSVVSLILFPISGLKILVIEYWILRFICNLVLGIWDLKKTVNGCEKHYPWSDSKNKNTPTPELHIKKGVISTNDPFIKNGFRNMLRQSRNLFLYRHRDLKQGGQHQKAYGPYPEGDKNFG